MNTAKIKQIIEEISENTYVANAMMRIDELVEFFNLEEDKIELLNPVMFLIYECHISSL